jgi:tetratricopeptide (TPR) repeat protein
MTLSYADASVAAELLESALKLDPGYPAAHAYLALCHQLRFVHDGRFDEVDKLSGIRHARAAIASDVDDATALAVAAITVAHLENNFDASLDAIERALSHNASCAAALFFGGEILAWKGESAAAMAYAQRALRLSPFDPLSCSPFQVAGTRTVCSRASGSEWPPLSRAGDTIIKTTVDHALMRGLATAGPVMRRGASSV